MSDPQLKWRREFPILNRTTYLISNSLGAMPRAVYKRMEDYADTWSSRGVRAWAEKWWDLPIRVGDVIAPLIGAGSGEISMHPNISLLQAILISCFDFKSKRNRVVLIDQEFPSILYVYQQFAARLGAKLKIVSLSYRNTNPTEMILKAIDERTCIVSISHVLFKNARLLDVKSIAERAHRRGAIVILDAYHSVGVLPVDVRNLDVDIFVGGVLKWLCGGPGGAFLWIKPSWRKKLKPAITGWFAHRRPFALEQNMEYRRDAFRFLNGTPSIPALYAAVEGPKILRRVGIQKVREKSIHQTSLIIERAQEYGFTITTPLNPNERGGTVTLQLPNANQVSQELLRRNILVDYRKGAGIRIAPHFYNSDEEILHTLGEMKSILSSNIHRSRTGKRLFGTSEIF